MGEVLQLRCNFGSWVVISSRYSVENFQSAARFVSERLTLCPGTKRCSIASYSHVLNRNSSLLSNPGGRSRLSHLITHTQVCGRLADYVSAFFYRSMRRCCSYCAHLSRMSLFIACSSFCCKYNMPKIKLHSSLQPTNGVLIYGRTDICAIYPHSFPLTR